MLKRIYYFALNGWLKKLKPGKPTILLAWITFPLLFGCLGPVSQSAYKTTVPTAPEFTYGAQEGLCDWFVNGATLDCVWMWKEDWFLLMELLLIQQQELTASCISQGQSKEDCNIE